MSSNGNGHQRHESVPIVDIVVPAGRRRVDEAKIKSLAQSIQRVGLLQYIGITPGYNLVFGAHRLKAVESLGRKTIDCVFVDADDLLRELAEIDENAERTALDALEWAQAMKRRKVIYEKLNGRIVRGKPSTDPTKTSVEVNYQNDNSLGNEADFAEDTAAQHGVSAVTVRRAVRRAEKIDEEVQEQIAGTPVADSNKELDALAALPVAEQKKAAKKIASGEAETVAEAAADKPKPKPKSDQPLDGDGKPIPVSLRPVFERAKEFDDLCRQLHAITTAIEKICGEPLGAHVHCQSVTADIDNAKRALRFGKPYAVCPYCKAKKPEACAACKGHGWVGKNLFKSAPEEMKS